MKRFLITLLFFVVIFISGWIESQLSLGTVFFVVVVENSAADSS